MDDQPQVVLRSCFRCGKEFSGRHLSIVCDDCRRTPSANKRPLTVREWQIIDLIAQGLANKEIATHLHLATGTIKEYLNRIFRKVGVQNRTALAIWGIQNKSIDTKTEGSS